MSQAIGGRAGDVEREHKSSESLKGMFDDSLDRLSNAGLALPIRAKMESRSVSPNGDVEMG